MTTTQRASSPPLPRRAGRKTQREREPDAIRAYGYLFLINLAAREYYLSTCGKAIDVYTNSAMDELFGEIQQFMVDGEYATAVNKVIEILFINQ